MKMTGFGHPLSEAPVVIAIDCDRIGRIWLALDRRDDTTLDPVMDDPEAHAVSCTDLADTERFRRNELAGYAVFVADPAYHADREGLAGCASEMLAIEQGDDLFIIMLVCQRAYLVDESV